MIKAIFLFLALAAGAAAPASAQAAPPEVVRIDVLDGGATARGTHQAGLRLTLADGWKTYWRAPGDAGIPPQFSWAGSQNAAAVALIWPAPVVFEQSGFQSIGYKSQVVLPLEITPREPGGPIRLRGRVDLGVCKDICIPATLDFERMLDPGAGRNPAIAAAIASRPLTAAEAGVASATCAVQPVRGGLRLTVRVAMPPAGGQEFAVIEPGDPLIWASEAEAARSGGVLSATADLVHTEGKPYALDRSALRITVLGDRHAVDIRGCTPG